MENIFKKYAKVRNNSAEGGKHESADEGFSHTAATMESIERRREGQLNNDEKKFLLAVERGDMSTVTHLCQQSLLDPDTLNINCVDPLGRNALLIAIEYENIEMIELLLTHHINVGESLLHAINEEFVEAVEILLAHQDQENIKVFFVKFQTFI
jgi:ankyrin repeat protein